MTQQDGRILVVVDPTTDPGQIAIDRSALLAQKLGLGLELLVCYYDPYVAMQKPVTPPESMISKVQVIDYLHQWLQGVAADLSGQGIDVVVTALWDRPLDEGIVRHVMQTRPVLVVKETHYHNRLSRFLFTHTDWDLIRNCPAPLWLARNQSWPSYPRILAAVDPEHAHNKPAELDTRILDTAQMLAENMGCDLHAFHAFTPPAVLVTEGMAPAYDMEDFTRAKRQEHQEHLNETIQGYNVAEDGVHLECGEASKVLPTLASDVCAGVVVMGAVKRSGWRHVFIDSTAEQVLPVLPCDLLIVKPSWFESLVPQFKPDVFRSTHQEGETTSKNDRLAG